MELALSAEFLVIDDLGAELDGIPIGSYQMPELTKPVSRLVAKRFVRNQPFVITTNMTREEIGARYTMRTERRIFEDAARIWLGPKRAPPSTSAASSART
jgi:hypothetical protein